MPVALVLVVIQFDFHPVGWYDVRFESLGRAEVDARSVPLPLRQMERKHTTMKVLAGKLPTPVRSIAFVLAGLLLAGLTKAVIMKVKGVADDSISKPVR